MAEKNGGEQLDDLETGNTKVGSSSMNTDITKESASTPTESPPISVNKENTIPTEDSKSKGGTEEGTDNSATPTSKICGCLVILLLVLIVLLLPVYLPVYYLIKYACLIVRAIAAPKKWTIWVVLEWIALVSFTGFLIASLTKQNLKNHLIWELELWKWCILLMVVVCGKLISQWIVNAVFLLISLLFADNLKVYCFAYGLKQKNRVFVWWGLVLIAWHLLVIRFGNRGGTRSEETKMTLDYVTRALASLTIGGGLWLAKDLLLWSFAISFQSKVFLERILKVNFYKFVTETLHSTSPRSVRESLITRYGFLDWTEEINEEKKSVVSIKLFVDSLSLDSQYKLKPKLENGKKDQEKENDAELSAPKIWEKIVERKSELDEARAKAAQSSNAKTGDNRFKTAGQAILNEVANLKRSAEDSPTSLISNFSRPDKNLPFTDAEVDMLFKLIGQTLRREEPAKGSDSKGFDHLLEIVYHECNSLESSLQNTRKGMEELNKLAKVIVIILIVIVWLLMLKVLSTQAVALILSQFFVLTFVFGDTCKKIFEGIIFVFVTHPFDIGDRCLIEGREEEVFVKKINIQTTVFSRVNPIDHKDDDDDDDNNEKIVYPNSVLATKHICNFHKIPTPPKIDTTDSVEFVVDASTSIEKIEALNPRLREYCREIEEESQGVKHISVHANGFVDGDKIKMGVYITYKSFWKDIREKSAWNSKIVLGLKQILEDMGISKYHKKIKVESVAAAIPPVVV